MKWFQMERILSNKYNHLLVVLVTVFILSPFVSDRHRVVGVSLLTVLFLGATLIALRAVITKTNVYYFWFFVACITLIMDAIGNTSFAENKDIDEFFRFAAFLGFLFFLP